MACRARRPAICHEHAQATDAFGPRIWTPPSPKEDRTAAGRGKPGPRHEPLWPAGRPWPGLCLVIAPLHEVGFEVLINGHMSKLPARAGRRRE